MVVLVTCKYNEDPSKNKCNGVLKTFLQLFFQTFKADNSAGQGRILPNFKPIKDFIAVLVTCKNEDNPIKNEVVRVLTTLYIDF